MADEVEPGRVGEVDVDQCEVGVAGLKVTDSVTHAIGNQHVEAVSGEVVGEEGARSVIFFD